MGGPLHFTAHSEKVDVTYAERKNTEEKMKEKEKHLERAKMLKEKGEKGKREEKRKG